MTDRAAPSTVALGQAVARRRREIGYSQSDLAAACAIHRAYIGGVEQGRRNPTWKVLVALAVGLEIDLADLVRRAESIEEEMADRTAASTEPRSTR